jgi:hypothetical protein
MSTELMLNVITPIPKQKQKSKKRWTGRHTMIVLDVTRGMDIKTVADKYGYAETTISNIVNSVQGKKIAQDLNSYIIKKNSDIIADQVLAIKKKTLDRIQDFVNNDVYEKANPFGFFDRMIKAVDSMTKVDSPKDLNPTVGSVSQTNIYFGQESNLKDLTDSLNSTMEVSAKYEVIDTSSVLNINSLEP